MNKIYALLIVAFFSFKGNAQIVSPIDGGFLYILTNVNCVDVDGDGVLDGDADTNDDGQIQVSEALAVKSLYFPNYGLSSLLGIGAFTNVKALNCSNCNLASLNLAGLTNLETLDCSYMPSLTFLNIADCLALKTLNCSGIRLTSLNVSAFTSLESLTCSGSYYGGLLTSLVVNGANNLKNIDCSYNKLTSLPIANMPNLTDLNCAGQNGTTALNLQMSGLPNLHVLDCSSNRLTSLNPNDFPALTSLNCYNNQIPTLDLSMLDSLTKLNCSTNTLNALNVSNLNLLEELSVSGNNLSTLDIANLVHLKSVNCNQNNLAQLDVSNQQDLKFLYCHHNNITALNVSNLLHLEELDCGHNELTALDVSNLSGLKQLSCNDNNVATLTLVNAPNLIILDCSHNSLSSLTIANFLNLRNLNCNDNALTAVDFTNLPKLTSIEARNNPFTTLDFSVMQTEIPPNSGYGFGMRYDLIGCTNLVYLNIKNGIRLAHQESVHDIVFSIEGCSNLTYMCVNDEDSGWYLGETIQVNSYCSFSPGGTYNSIAGKLTYDLNNNGCDANDSFSLNTKMKIDDGTTSGASFADANGDYRFFTQAGTFTITPDFENPYFTVSPSTASVNFEDSNNNTQTRNFCITPNGIHNDVEITLVPVQNPRPGFDTAYQLVYKNKGNQTLSGNIHLTFDDAVIDFVSANPALTTQSLNTLHWSYSDLKPFETRIINFTLNINSPMEIPAVHIGDLLNFVAVIDPVSGDETIADNTFSLRQTVVGSFDPNDKTCIEGNTMTPEMVGGYLHYVIRFQNSGSAAAENIVVKDVIDTTKFDINSFQLTSSSHPFTTRITGNVIEFQLANINLPAESENEPASHGYIAFKIKTKADLTIGNSVENKAGIYFDYNFPVETNTATTTVSLLAKNTFEDKSISVFPNPVKDKINIRATSNIVKVALFDVQGRLISTAIENSDAVTFDLGKNGAGVYFLKIYTDQGVKVEKLLKQ